MISNGSRRDVTSTISTFWEPHDPKGKDLLRHHNAKSVMKYFHFLQIIFLKETFLLKEEDYKEDIQQKIRNMIFTI